jgi:hypothetical protein
MLNTNWNVVEVVFNSFRCDNVITNHAPSISLFAAARNQAQELLTNSFNFSVQWRQLVARFAAKRIDYNKSEIITLTMPTEDIHKCIECISIDQLTFHLNLIPLILNVHVIPLILNDHGNLCYCRVDRMAVATARL